MSFPRRLNIDWTDATFATRSSLVGHQVVVGDKQGRSVALTLTQVASGVVFDHSKQWRDAAVEALARHLAALARGAD